MGIKDLLKIFINSNNGSQKGFYPDYSQDDKVKIYLKENGKTVIIDDISKEDIFVLISSTNLNISDDKEYLYITYDNLYDLYYDDYNKFSDDYTYFNLPSLYNGFIYIDNDGNFNEHKEVKFTFGFDDGKSYDIKRVKNNIVIVNDEYYLLPKDMYELLKKLIEYNNNAEKNSKIQEQLGFLVPLKQYANKSNLILSQRLQEEEEPIVIDKIKLDFKKDRHSLEIIPVIEGKDEKFNKEFVKKFDESNEIKNFYNVLDNGSSRKVLFKNKNAAEKIKRDRVLTGEKLNQFLRGENELLNDEENFDTSAYGPRVIGLGYLTYRANASMKSEKDESWFDTDLETQNPTLYTNEDSIILNPEHKEVFQKKLVEIEEESLETIEVPIEQDGQTYKVIMKKEEIINEIEKINNAIVDIDKINSITKLNEIRDKINDNPKSKFIEYKGKYIKNYGIEAVEDRIRYVKNSKNDSRKNKREKELLVKENLDTLEYKEDVKQEKRYPIEIPKSLKLDFYPHQKEGFYKLQNLYRTSKINGFLLADDMGLGKTLQLLALLAWIKETEGVGPSLIVAPSTLIDNWDNEDPLSKGEIQKFFCGNTFTTFKIRGTLNGRELEKINNTDIILTSYESLRINHKALAVIHWKVVICDEAQKIKNATTRVSAALKAQNADFKIACSATPIENTTLDLWNIMDYAIPGLLGSRRDFAKSYVNAINNLDKTDSITRKELNNSLIGKIESNFLRRSKEEELEGLPKKIIRVIKVSANPKEREIISSINDKRSSGSENALPLIQRMIALCSHEELIKQNDIKSLLFSNKEMKLIINNSSKLQALKSILDDIKIKNEKVIIFTIFRKMQQILVGVIKYWYGINSGMINGTIEQGKRKDIFDSFRKSRGFDVIVLSPEVAGVGITLTEANHVVHYTRLWNPAKEAQATDRAYRIGQDKDVYVYYPILTYEENEEKIFSCEQEYIDYFENVSTKGKTPEEKLNRILVRKKNMLNNFFLAAGESKVDVANEWDEEESKESNYVTLYDVINILKPDEFEALCSLIYKKKGYRSFLTVKSGDKGVDVVVEKDNKYSLIQCKLLSNKNITKSALSEVYGATKIYSSYLSIQIENKIVISTAELITNDTKEFSKFNGVEIILKDGLNKLLNENKIYYSEIYLENQDRYSIEKLKNEI